MTPSTYVDITSKMAGQKNLLFIFSFEVNKEKLIACYFTFGQVDHQASSSNQDNKKSTPPNQKTSVPNCVGDFMLIGANDSQKVAVIADLLNTKQSLHMHGSHESGQNLALSWVSNSAANPNQ